MKTQKRRIIGLLVMVGLVASPAMAWDDCTFAPFIANLGVWDSNLNWDNCSGFFPVDGDTATIPSGKTCTVDTTEACTSFTVDSGGILDLKGVTTGLTFTVSSDSTVNGTLKFTDTGMFSFQIVNSLTLSGSGTIDGQGTGGVFCESGTSNPDLTTQSTGGTLTVTGTIIIWSIGLINNATWLVDTAGDTIDLGLEYEGDLFGLQNLGGSGTFKVTAGTMQLNNIRVWDGSSTFTWDLDGGTLRANGYCFKCNEWRGDIDQSGGTLDLVKTLCSTDNIDFSGGTITVAASRTGDFGGTCP